MRSVDSRATDLGRAPYFVAAICFGPLLFVLLLGLVAVPIWVSMIAMQVAEPEQFSNESSGTIWDGVSPLLLMISGFIGVAGILRVLGLLRRGRASVTSRRITVAMVAVGLIALLAFDAIVFVPGVFSEEVGNLPVAGLFIYVVGPFYGAVWLLRAAGDMLFAEQR
jgi:hypothetical protein